MRKISYSALAGFLTALFYPQPGLAQFGKPKGPPKAKLELLSSVEAVSPGEPFDLGIRFKLKKGWHIYWHNSGDSGLPPRIKWELPQGFRADPIRFPVPKRHVDRFDAETILVTNILDGDPVLLVRITPSSSVVEGKVKLAASVAYLICEKNCIRETAELALELPVFQGGATPKPAREELFKQAYQRLPKTESRFLTVSPSVTTSQLAPGRMFELALDVLVAPDVWIHAHEPADARFTACNVFVKRVDDLFIEQPVYPKATTRKDPTLGAVQEYRGTVTIRVPIEVADEDPSGPVEVGGIVSYQPCLVDGKCHDPEAVAFSLTIGGEAKSKTDTGAAATGTTEGAAVTGPTEGTADAPVSPEDQGDRGFWERAGLPGLLLACFLYGLFINATPCVLPLLSIKVLGFVQQAHESRSRTLVLGLAFGLGVILFFVLLGLLASTGRNVLQYPAAVIVLGAVVLALSLSMLGVYTLQAPSAATNLEAQIQKEGVLASFGKGALAPVLGFACTGPLLAGAFGWATQQPPTIAIVAFLFAGLGMASPYMLLGANPHWLSFLPKPGNWMITFERIMGFLLLAMVVWLLHPLVSQIGPEGLEWTLGVLVFVGMGCWLLGKIDFSMSSVMRWRYRLGAALLVAVPALVVYGWIYPLGKAQARQRATAATGYAGAAHWSSGIPWRRWSAEEVASTVHAGHTVFVDFTAAYCTSCKQNKAVAINTPEAREKMRDLGVVPFQADFTNGDREIFAALQKFNRAGPPLNLIYPAGRPDRPIVLSTLFKKEYLLAKLDEAARLAEGPSGT